MKNMQLLPEEEEEEGDAAGAREAARWKRLCLQELRGLKKLRRNQKEEEEEERRRRRRRRRGAAPRRAPTPRRAAPQEQEALDLRSGQAFPGPREPRPPPRLQGPPPAPLPPALPPGLFPPPAGSSSSSAPLPPAALHRSRPQAPLSPGSSRRPPPPPLPPLPPPGAEPSPGPPSEMKALQQTRRLLANARERTRVHTISAAFEALRKQVPCYSYGQKLSKLAILRIACNYILSLARLADLDYSADHSNMSFSECVEQCTRTLQAEGRSKKRKE